MRIAFIGCSGTGKSVLMNHVHDKFSLPVCPIGSRETAKSLGFDNPYDVDKAGKRAEFQKKLFVDKLKWETAHESFVTDRTPFDNLAYATMHGVMFEKAQLLEYVEAMRRYTHIFHLPLDVFQNLGNDPHRVTVDGYHIMFEVLIKAFVLEWKVPCMTLKCKIEDRQLSIENWLRDT